MASDRSAARQDLAAAAGLALLSLAIAVRRPLFHDEASTWYFCRDGLGGLLAALRGDVHPPGWFVVAWGWFAAAGDSVEGLRVLSCLAVGAGLFLFLKAWRMAFPQADCAALAWVLATSPIMAFAGSFARYYGFAVLAVAGVAWGLARVRQNPVVARAAVAGALAGLCAHVNYAAAFVAGPVGLVAVLMIARGRGWKLPAAYVTAALLVGLPLVPLLAEQLAGATRVGGDAAVLARGLVFNGAYLVYTLAAGDGLPPQFGVGALLAAVHGIAATVGVTRAWRERGDAAAVAVLALVALGLAVVLGALTFPGPSFIFLPPRVAFVGLAWGVLLATARSRKLIAVVVAGNLLSLAMTIGPGLTTNWAYRIPLDEIADEVASELAASELPPSGAGAAIWLPERSLANVRLVLERRFPALAINATSEETRLVLTLDEARESGAQLTRAEAAGWPAEAPPRREAMLLEEDAATRWLKEAVLRRPVARAKLRLAAHPRP